MSWRIRQDRPAALWIASQTNHPVPVTLSEDRFRMDRSDIFGPEWEPSGDAPKSKIYMGLFAGFGKHDHRRGNK